MKFFLFAVFLALILGVLFAENLGSNEEYAGVAYVEGDSSGAQVAHRHCHRRCGGWGWGGWGYGGFPWWSGYYPGFSGWPYY